MKASTPLIGLALGAGVGGRDCCGSLPVIGELLFPHREWSIRSGVIAAVLWYFFMLAFMWWFSRRRQVH